MINIEFYADKYEAHLKGLGFADNTIRLRMRTLKSMDLFFNSRNLKDFRNVRQEHLEQYLNAMKDKSISKGTLEQETAGVKVFFNYLFRQELIILNPVEDLNFKAKGIERQRGVFSVEEISRFLDNIEPISSKGQRERALFELMYSSALRVNEVINLNLDDILLKERMVLIRQGKGFKDRLVPMSGAAFTFIKLYIENERAYRVEIRYKRDEKALFIALQGRIARDTINRGFNLYLKKAHIEKKNRSLHSIRHSAATHLLESGADIRDVSDLLGHENLETTVRYTHLEAEGLRKAYRMYHPRENELYLSIDDKYLDDLEILITELKLAIEYKKQVWG